ncbi:MAG: hypothetical protein WCP01_11500 [Methylococcaceae bacterium]
MEKSDDVKNKWRHDGHGLSEYGRHYRANGATFEPLATDHDSGLPKRIRNPDQQARLFDEYDPMDG